MASGGKGYYATQAASASAQGWNAADFSGRSQRREAEGLLNDNDFAYAYTLTTISWLGSLAIMWPMTGCKPGRESRRACWPQGHKQLKATLRPAAPCEEDDLQEKNYARPSRSASMGWQTCRRIAEKKVQDRMQRRPQLTEW